MPEYTPEQQAYFDELLETYKTDTVQGEMDLGEALSLAHGPIYLVEDYWNCECGQYDPVLAWHDRRQKVFFGYCSTCEHGAIVVPKGS